MTSYLYLLFLMSTTPLYISLSDVDLIQILTRLILFSLWNRINKHHIENYMYVNDLLEITMWRSYCFCSRRSTFSNPSKVIVLLTEPDFETIYPTETKQSKIQQKTPQHNIFYFQTVTCYDLCMEFITTGAN